MTVAERLQSALVAVEANATFTHASMRFHDGSRLEFCHRVDERWARAVAPTAPAVASSEPGAATALATDLLSAITRFRLNARHLDIQFTDNSRWDHPVAPWP
jgi:hypothetical protein